MPSVPGLVSEIVVPAKSSAVSAAAAGLAHDLLVGRPELGEVHRLAALDRHHDQRCAAPPLPGRSIARPRLTWSGVTTVGLAVDLGEVPVHRRELGQRPHDGVPDEVGEGDLPAAGPPQLVVDHHPVVGQQLRRHGAHGRGGRHLERGLHVLDDRPTRHRATAWPCPPRPPAPDARPSRRCPRRASPARASAAAAVAHRRRPVGPGACAVPLARRAVRSSLRGGLAGTASVAGLRRGRLSWDGAAVGAGAAPSARAFAAAVQVPVSRPVVGEEVVPGRVDRSRVVEEALVHLLDEPFVGAELAGLAGHTAAGHAENRLDRIASSSPSSGRSG